MRSKTMFRSLLLVVLVLCLLPLQGLGEEVLEIPGSFVTTNDGIPLWVTRYGTGDKAIVFLAGLGASSATLEYKPMAQELLAADDGYSVYIIEYPGTGFSPQTKTPRTIENITTELHDVLGKLGLSSFTAVGHSISGLYMLYYVNQYPGEVNAFIGIDNSVPAQGELIDYTSIGPLLEEMAAGLDIPFEEINPEDHPEFYILVNDYEYTDAEQALYMQLTRNSLNATVLNEYSLVNHNCDAAMDMSFPAELPVLLLVSRESGEGEEGIPGWFEMHEALLGGHLHSMILYDGPHYLHFVVRTEMMKDIFAFLDIAAE